MTRHADALALAEDLLTDVELAQTSTSHRALKASRLARLTRNAEAQVWIEYEIHGVPDTEAGKRWMTKTSRWLDEDKEKGLWGSAAEIESWRDSGQRALDAHAAPLQLSGDMLLSITNSRNAAIATYTTSVHRMQRVLSTIDAQIYRFATDTDAELKYSEIQASLFERSRESVEGTLVAVAGDALKKIETIGERLSSGDEDAASHAMTTCRQLIDNVADHVFTPCDDPYLIGEKPLEVKANNVLNRINAFVHKSGVTGSRAARIRRALADLYGRISTGVHKTDGVDTHEAQYLFLNTYVLLGEILTLRPHSEEVPHTDVDRQEL